MAKALAAIEAGLTPILCVGETLEDFEAQRTEAVLEAQLAPVFANHALGVLKKVMIAYEPVWAIGSGKAASPKVVGAVHGFIRKWLQSFDQGLGACCPILYGGSVNPDNLADLLYVANVNGALVGGAALKVELWNAMVALCKR